METVKFSKYRGKIEPVGEVRMAEFTLYENHLEIIQDYDFERFDDAVYHSDQVRYAEILNKNTISVSRSAIVHNDDPDKEQVPAVVIDSSTITGEPTHLGFKSAKEADEIYIKLRDWLVK